MDRRKTEPLTTEEAKLQLRAAAGRIGITSWVRRQPFGAVITGLLTGFLAAKVPRLLSRLTQSGVGQHVFDRLV